jgi:hypothetical protein
MLRLATVSDSILDYLILEYGKCNAFAARFFASSPRRSYLWVVETDECPAIAATVLMSTPASSISDTKDRRISWGVIDFTAAFFAHHLILA